MYRLHHRNRLSHEQVFTTAARVALRADFAPIVGISLLYQHFVVRVLPEAILDAPRVLLRPIEHLLWSQYGANTVLKK